MIYAPTLTLVSDTTLTVNKITHKNQPFEEEKTIQFNGISTKLHITIDKFGHITDIYQSPLK